MPEPVRPRGMRRIVTALPTIARTRMTRAITRVPTEQVRRAHADPRIMRALAPARWWLDRGAVSVASGPAAGMRFSKRDLPVTHAQAYYLPRGILETDVQEALRRTVRDGSVVWDVGANIGFFSLLAARLVGERGRVVSFEPVPACAAAVRRNAALNGLSERIEVREVAVSADSGRARLLVVGEASWSHLAERGRHPGTTDEIDVETASADDLVASGTVPAPDVVKLDVEGSELDVLRGMRQVIADHRPVIVCELHGTNAEFVELLGGLGYRIENLDGPEPVEEADSVHALATPA